MFLCRWKSIAAVPKAWKVLEKTEGTTYQHSNTTTKRLQPTKKAAISSGATTKSSSITKPPASLTTHSPVQGIGIFSNR